MARSKTTNTDPKVRTLGAQLQTLSSENLKTIVDNILTGVDRSVSPPPSSPKKRKQIAESPKSDIVPETPSPKKKKSAAKPVVDSPVIRALENMMAANEVPSGRPIRSRTKTEKGLAMEALQAASKTKNKAAASGSVAQPAPFPVKRLESPIDLVESEDELPPAPRFASPVKDAEPAKAENPFIDNEAVEENADVISLSSNDNDADVSGDDIDEEMKDFIVPDDEGDSQFNLSDASMVAERGSVIREFEDEISSDEDGGASPVVDREISVEVEVSKEILDYLSVMDPAVQEDVMKPSYEGLPELDRVFFTRPYNYDAELPNGNLYYAPIVGTAELMSPRNAKSLFSCLFFVNYNNYVNAARIAPTLVTDSQGRLSLAGNLSRPTALITAGVVSSSHLFASSVTTGFQQKYEQHRLTILKFHQEAQRENALIAQTFNMYSGVFSTCSAHGFAYVTRGSNQDDDKKGASTAGAFVSKNQQAYTRVPVPVMHTVRSVLSRKPFIDFSERVPIFDGRAETGEPFRFRPEDFDRLNVWRAWGENKTELPVDAVVAIGYNANHFSNKEGHRYLTLNILFVIVLHIPKRVVALADPPVASGSGKGNTKAVAKPKGKGKGRA
ncbi:hypothetical protein H0H93_013253 [Arthromyces matolae]|nr:hypothetical protein H0H93_013253 [Arthromyces matolae]